MVSLQDAHAQETLRIVWMEPVQTVIVKKKYIVGENVSLVPPLVSIIREIAHRVMMVKLRIVVPHTPIALANVPRRGNIALMALVQSATQVHNIGIVMVKGVLRVTINVVRVMKDVHHVREPMYVRMEPVNLVPLVAFTIMENAQSVEATVAPVIRAAMTLVHRVSIVLIIPVQRAKRINIGMVQSVPRVGTTVVPIIKTVQYAPSLRYVSIKPVNFVSMELSMTMENAQRVGRAVVPNTPIVLKHVHRPSIVLIIPVQHARRINIGMIRRRSVPHVGPNVETTFLDVHAQETLWIALMEPVQTVIAKIKYIMAKPVNLVPLVAFTIMDNAQIVALTVGTAFQDVQRALPPPYARTEPVNLVPPVTFTIMEHAHRALMLPLPTAEPKNVRKDVPMRGSIVLMVLAQSVSRGKEYWDKTTCADCGKQCGAGYEGCPACTEGTDCINHTCGKCAEGTYYDSDSGTCLPCTSGTCSKPYCFNFCTDLGQICGTSGSCENCQSGFYFDPDSKKCTKCKNGQCGGTCGSCGANATCNNGTCQCNSGYSPPTDGSSF